MILSLLFSLTAVAQTKAPAVHPLTTNPLAPRIGSKGPAVAGAADNDPLSVGRRLYTANCLQCHNKDPHLKGSLGPPQIDTPWEVFQVKVVTGRYPETFPAGYKPLRTTKAMKKFPQLEKDLPALFAYIQSFKKK